MNKNEKDTLSSTIFSQTKLSCCKTMIPSILVLSECFSHSVKRSYRSWYKDVTLKECQDVNTMYYTFSHLFITFKSKDVNEIDTIYYGEPNSIHPAIRDKFLDYLCRPLRIQFISQHLAQVRQLFLVTSLCSVKISNQNEK